MLRKCEVSNVSNVAFIATPAAFYDTIHTLLSDNES